MMKIGSLPYLLGAAMLCCSGYAVAQDEPASPAPAGDGSRLAAAIKRLDKNGDGKLGRDEVGPKIAAYFDRLDTDHDGLLTATELAGIRAFMGAGAQGAGAGGQAGGARFQRGQDAGASADGQPRRRFAGRRGGGMGGLGGRGARGGGAGGTDAVAMPATDAAGLGAALAAQTAKMTTDLGLQGAAVIVARGDGQGHYRDVVRTYTGGYKADTVVPVASTTKWFTAATVASVVDSGKLNFDDPITKYIPDVPADKRAITVRQTLSHVSGLDALSPMVERSFPGLKEAAANILSKPLVGEPGTVMKYSGTAMQVAGRAAEIAGGADFRTLFKTRIADPLGLAHTAYGGGPDNAPVAGGGINTSPADLERFTQMIAGRGKVGNVRVLSKRTMDDMTVLRTKGVRILQIPGAAQPFAGMGTGIWCERADAAGKCLSMSAVGAFGTYAWVDYEHDEYGVMVVRTALNKAMPYWRGMRAAIDQARAQR